MRYPTCECATYPAGVRITQTYATEGVFTQDGNGDWWATNGTEALTLRPQSTSVVCCACNLPLLASRIDALAIFPDTKEDAA